MPRSTLALSLFWRTFVLLALLLAGGVFAWVQTLRALEFEPRAMQEAQQIASLVNLSRAALRQADGITRVTLLKSMGSAEAVQVRPREPGDRVEPYEIDRFTGLAAARDAIHAARERSRFRTASIVDAGKNAWVVERALREAGVTILPYGQDAEASVIGTMSPGPMLDAFKRRTAARRGRGPIVIAPWLEAMPELRTNVQRVAA